MVRKPFLRNMFGGSPAAGESVEELKATIERLERAVGELSILNDLAFAIGASADPEEVVRTLVDKLMRSIDAEQAVVTLVDREDTNNMQTNVRVRRTSVEGSAFSLKDAILGWMHLYKKALISNDPHNDTTLKGVAWDPSVHSVICVPMLIKAELTGIVSVYNKRGGGGFTAEDERLLTIIATQSAQIVENARLYQESLQLARMQDEAQNAYQIQRMMLPPPPAIKGYDVAAESVPAREVGGDYFDFVQADDGRWAISLGDVSGKGLPAALLMSNCHATVRAQTHLGTTVSEKITTANRLLSQSTDDEKFVTLFYGELDTGAHTLTFANAGHEHPYHLSSNGDVQRLSSSGIPLSALDDFEYREGAITVEPGDLIVVFSDGVTDATNEFDQPFGEERLAGVIEEHRDASCARLVEVVLKAAGDHAGTAEQFDDMTLVVLRRL